jgi:hypothetical protein
MTSTNTDRARRSPAVRHAARRYRTAARYHRLARRNGWPGLAADYAAVLADARAELRALLDGAPSYTDHTGAVWGLTGADAGLLLAGPAPAPGVWFGGAGF